MEIAVEPGKYVLAVSGGVDSMALLNLLKDTPSVEIIIAHFNHQIRSSSDQDEQLVLARAKELNLPFEVGYGNLGPAASEERARRARYQFLEKVREKHNAKKIITAHHQDDVIETAIINLLRGSGSRGLTAMGLNPHIVRPLLDVPKSEILKYAKQHNLAWREDETNDSQKYLRNRIRVLLKTKLTPEVRREILERINEAKSYANQTDAAFRELKPLIFDGKSLNRQAFILLPDSIANELMLRWLREQSVNIDRRGINRLTIAAKTAKPASRHNVTGKWKLQVDARRVFLTEA